MIPKKQPFYRVRNQRVPQLSDLQDALGIDPTCKDSLSESIPFSGRDATAGAENEFQAVVLGKRKNLDLAITIEDSNYYKNLIRRAQSGDTSRKTLAGLEKYLDQKKDQAWENSWVRFPKSCLNTYARHIFQSDLKSDKTDPGSGYRKDTDRFTFEKDAEVFIRIPVSYLLKLSLADAIGENIEKQTRIHPFIRITGEKMMSHFSNDNTSPEIFSFYPVRSMSKDSVGTELARETLIRFLFTQLLVEYAQDSFALKHHGQEVRVFFSSSPPLMQKQLNDCISDSFYRYLFMSPCLSGWDCGENKFHYMKQCHKVLSRSQINAISKLKEAGIINSNLVVLPNSSNISLANNGTHISLGSRKLSRLIQDPDSLISSVHEKQIGDLVIKICEHFLPLFPGTFSASPYRLNFEDFHPEKVLGFLPHELDYTHLRMIWQKWKKKAKNKILGRPFTPFGPVWFDRLLSKTFRLKGDFIPDFRLIDYFVSLMSTDQSPSLNGLAGNSERLKKDLSQMGIFNEDMPLYQLIRLRHFSQIGYSGFEHRHYSIFENIMTDMGQACDLQTLITTLAYQYALTGKITHDDIPDTPDIESERRQIFFGSAIDLPVFFVKTRTKNQFLQKILSTIKKTPKSTKYPGYSCIRMADYKKALIETLKTDGKQFIENMHLSGMISDLEIRIKFPKTQSTAGRLVNGILHREKKKSPLDLKGEQFNKGAEKFYFKELRNQQIQEAFAQLEKEFYQMDLWACFGNASFKEAIGTVTGQQSPNDFLNQFKENFNSGTHSTRQTQKMIFLIILYINQKEKVFQGK